MVNISSPPSYNPYYGQYIIYFIPILVNIFASPLYNPCYGQYNRDQRGGDQNIDKKGITFPPVDIVGIHSGLMIQCLNLTGGESNEKKYWPKKG